MKPTEDKEAGQDAIVRRPRGIRCLKCGGEMRTIKGGYYECSQCGDTESRH